MKNKKLLQKTIDKYLIEVTIGSYEDEVIENFTHAQITRVREKLKYGENADLKFIYKGKPIMLQIVMWYGEVDIYTMGLDEYNSYFGENIWG